MENITEKMMKAKFRLDEAELLFLHNPSDVNKSLLELERQYYKEAIGDK